MSKENVLEKENMENEVDELLLSDELIQTINSKVSELHAANPKLKRLYPIYVEGDECDGKEHYIGYFKQPSFTAFSKYMSLSQKDQVGAMRELAKDCFVDGDKELIVDESLFIYGLMPHLVRLIEVRKGKLVNLSKAGK